MRSYTVYTKELLHLLAEGDESVLKSLFKIYRDKLFAYIFKITKSREASEEIVMDVFMKLWLSRNLVTEIENFEGFIFKVACNKSLDFLRTVAKDRKLEELVWYEIQAASDSESDQNLNLRELKHTIDTLVQKLPKQRQAVFRLSREQGMTYDQIAFHLHLSKGTVKNHMLDAIRFMRQNLNAPADSLLVILILWVK